MLNILIMVDQLSLRGGTEKYLYTLSNELSSRGFNVTVISLIEGEYSKKFKENEKISYNCLHVKRIYDMHGFSAILKIKKIIIDKKIDLLQTTHSGSDIIGPIAARLSSRQIRIISSRRDLGYTKKKRHIFIQRFVNKMVDGILANSNAVKQSILNQEAPPENMIKIIPNGIKLSVQDNLNKEHCKRFFCDKLDLPPNCLLVGTAGSLGIIKGHIFLLKSALILINKFKNLYFIFAGDGPQRKELVRYCVDNNMSQKVFFIGNIKDVYKFYKALDVYVQPSLSEGFSNSIIEAMSCSCPIIATSVGGNKDLIGEKNGYLVGPKDYQYMSDKIELLLSNPVLMQSIGEFNRLTVEKKFSLNNMIDQYVHYYQSLFV